MPPTRLSKDEREIKNAPPALSVLCEAGGERRKSFSFVFFIRLFDPSTRAANGCWCTNLPLLPCSLLPDGDRCLTASPLHLAAEPAGCSFLVAKSAPCPFHRPKLSCTAHLMEGIFPQAPQFSSRFPGYIHIALSAPKCSARYLFLKNPSSAQVFSDCCPPVPKDIVLSISSPCTFSGSSPAVFFLQKSSGHMIAVMRPTAVCAAFAAHLIDANAKIAP